MTVIPIVIVPFGTVPKGLEKRMEELEIRGTIDLSIAEIDQNTQKSPGDLKRLAVTQTPLQDNQLTLV